VYVSSSRSVSGLIACLTPRLAVCIGVAGQGR
jgi:hypothetical protein